MLEDLDERGLLEPTLVVWVGEFGRSPRINNMAGRDHWPLCYTALLAGGGYAEKVAAPVPHPTRHGSVVRGGKPDAAFGVKIPRKPYQALRVRRKR